LERERHASRAILGLDTEAIDPSFQSVHGCHVFSTQQGMEQHTASGTPLSIPSFQAGASNQSADELFDSLMQTNAYWSKPSIYNKDLDSFINTDFTEFGGISADDSSGGSVSSLPSLLTSNSSTFAYEKTLAGQRPLPISYPTGQQGETTSQVSNRPDRPSNKGTNSPHVNKNGSDLGTTEASPSTSSQHLTSLAPLSTSERSGEALSKGSSEEIFTRILLLMEEAGFEDMDAMIQAYYTAKFRYDSVAHWAQKRSRVKRLGPLLRDLSRDATSWSTEEATNYQEAILGIADGMCNLSVNDDTGSPSRSMRDL
jgi:hypothetical protein